MFAKLSAFNVILFACCLFALGGCDKRSGNPTVTLNANLELPQGSYQVNPDEMEVDSSISIDPGMTGTMPINTGTQLNGQISFTAPNANVVAGGMRFGDSGPVNVVPVNGAQGQTNGTLSLPFSLSANTCNNLSQICHDIKCYEFAVTADGKISQANIRDVALMCGACDEPSCQSLINPPCPGVSSYNFSLHSGSSSSTSGCGSNNIGIVDDGWVISIVNVSTQSGSVSFSPGYYDGTCSTCPALQISSPAGIAYISLSGTGSWSGNVFTFSSNSMKTITDFINSTGTSYTISGSVSC